MRRRNTRTLNLEGEDTDPLAGMANLFDIAMVFAVALMVAMVLNFRMTDMLTEDEVTIVKNPGKENMEVVVKKGQEITKYQGSENTGEGKGKRKRIGVAYELEDGRIIYVPE